MSLIPVALKENQQITFLNKFQLMQSFVTFKGPLTTSHLNLLHRKHYGSSASTDQHILVFLSL